MITSKEVEKINFNSKPKSLDPARRKSSCVSWFMKFLSAYSGTLSSNFHSRDRSKGQAAYLLIEERIFQIKWENCFAS